MLGKSFKAQSRRIEGRMDGTSVLLRCTGQKRQKPESVVEILEMKKIKRMFRTTDVSFAIVNRTIAKVANHEQQEAA